MIPESPPSKRPTVPVTLQRLRQLYAVGLGALALPALLLGVPLGSQIHYSAELGRLLALVAVGCTLLSFYFSWRQSKEGLPESVLSAALTLASATGVPLLLASVLWHQAAALWPLLGLALVAWGASWALLSVWAGQGIQDGEKN